MKEFWNDLDRKEKIDALGLVVTSIGGYFAIVLISGIFG